jgi:hypothetical protein
MPTPYGARLLLLRDEEDRAIEETASAKSRNVLPFPPYA